MTDFPADFFWGASTAGHQVEGGNVNADLWPLEWAERSIFTEPAKDGPDHYHRYPEDIALLAGLGLDAYRFSLEWSRIEPEPGFFSRAALDHYRRVMSTCREDGVEPVVTLNHFTYPRWFAGAGGWAAPDAADRFGRYAEAATKHLGDLFGWVATLNEPNIRALLEHTGALPMGTGDRAGLPAAASAGRAGVGGYDGGRYRMSLLGGSLAQMTAAHRRAQEAVKSVAPHTRIGWTLALPDLQEAEGGAERLVSARKGAELDWLDVSRQDDWVGVQAYYRDLIGPDGVVKLEGVPRTQTGWEIYPPALAHSVRLAAQHAGVPVVVTEHGMATDDDDARQAYTRESLVDLAAAIADGVDVRGYLHWSFLDNWEWTAGYAHTFGLVAYDHDTFERTVKPTATWLGQVAKAGVLS